MARADLKLVDVVVLLRDLPQYRLRRGQVGTVVQVYKSGRYEVEFADNQGKILELVTLSGSALLPLSYERPSRGPRRPLVA